MKKIYGFLIMAFIVFSCTTKENDYAIVSGKVIAKSSVKDISISSFTQKRKKVKLESDSTFTDTIFIDKPNLYYLKVGGDKVTLYLEKGANINVLYDFKDKENKAVITGEKSEKSKAIEDYRKEFTKKFYEFSGGARYNPYEIAMKGEEEYLEYHKQKKAVKLGVLNSFEGLPDLYKRLVRFEAEVCDDYMMGVIYKELHGKVMGNPDFEVSDNFPKIDLPLDNEEMYKQSRSYTNLVRVAVEVEVKKKQEEDESLSDDLTALEVTNNIIKNQYIKNRIMYSFASYAINLRKTEEQKKAIIDFFNKNSTEEYFKNRLAKKVAELNQVVKGSVSPKFVDYENHAGGTTSLDDFKGKYVYIDIWATWCGPCIKEIPALKELEKEYHGKNIEFISISVDKSSDYEKWKKMVTDKNLTGVQLIADKVFESDFIKSYSITTIPRFLLIDPQGNVVSTHAPRPSDPEVRKLFKSLNI